jgi:hypothetical protein
MSILKNFVNPWGLDTGVLDTGVLDTDVLKTSVLDDIVEDGGGGGRTIVFTEDGIELYRAKDMFEHAIVVMSKEGLTKFNKMLKSPNRAQSKSTLYRSYGTMYMTDGILKLFKKSTEKKFLRMNNFEYSFDGKNPVRLYPEWEAAMIVVTDEKRIEVDEKTMESATNPLYSRLYPIPIHTHPNGYHRDIFYREIGIDAGTGKEFKSVWTEVPVPMSEEPSAKDWISASDDSVYYGIVVSPNNIYLYRKKNGKKQLITAPMSFFEVK